MSDWEREEEEEEALGRECEATLFEVEASQVGSRLDALVGTMLSDATRSEAKRLIELTDEAGVWVNERREKASYKARLGDRVRVLRPQTREIEILPEAIPLDIYFEDSEMLVINKPKGMVVHPAPGAESGTLVNAVLAHAVDLSGIGGAKRPGIVHRLDKDTSGLIMVAKSDNTHRALQAQIQARTAERRYKALVWGVPKFQHATIDAPIGRHPVDRKRMAVLTEGRYTSRVAKTELFVLQRFAESFTLMEAKLHTGRTHQIRVHTSFAGHPVVGDPVYGGLRKVPSPPFSSSQQAQLSQAIEALEGQALHAWSLAFDHPKTGERLHFTSPLPDSFQSLVDLLTGLS